MKKLLLSFGLLVLGVSMPLSAQDNEMVTLRFLSFPKSVRPEPVHLRLPNGEILEAKAPSNSMSPTYEVPRLAKWSVGQLELNEEGKPVFTEYGAAPSHSSKEQLILLIRKGKKNADGIEVMPMDNSAGNFSGGEFFFMNAAKVDIAGILGGNKFMLKPGKFTIIKPKELVKRGGEEMGKVFTQFFFKNATAEAKEFFSSTWPANKKARSMIFFYHDDHSKRLRFHTVRDFMP